MYKTEFLDRILCWNTIGTISAIFPSHNGATQSKDFLSGRDDWVRGRAFPVPLDKID